MRVGFVSTRLAGTDGVSLETAKLVTILERMGHEAFYCAGKLDPEGPTGLLVPQMHFAHPRARQIHDEAFLGPAPQNLRARISAMAEELKTELAGFVDLFGLDLLFPQNALSIPMHLPLGIALSEFIAENAFPTIAHHHDLYWERERFANSAVPDILEQFFPPALPSIRHLVINSLAQAELARRKGVTAQVLPNIFDFETLPPGPDDYNADLRANLGLALDDRLILQPTRVVPRKGIELSIELLHRLGDPRCKLLITHHAGDEGMQYLRDLQNLAQKATVDLHYAADQFAPQRTTTKSGRKQYSLWDAYTCANFVSYPSLIEGFGNALLESIYFCRPTLVNRYPVYVQDIAPLGFDLVEIEGAITDETVAEVQHLLNDSRRRQQVTAHNFELGRCHFSYSTAEHILRPILDEVL